MDEGQTSPAPAKKPSKKVFLIIFTVFGLGIIGGGAFFFASRRGGVSPTPSPSPTESPFAQPLESPTLSPSPILSPSPTPKKTPTPTPTSTPTLKSKTINSTSSLDGFRSSNGGGNAGVDIRSGRNVNLVTRGFVSFDLSSLPSGAKVQKATLRLYQYEIIGSPYGTGGSLKIDHLDYGDSLGDEDYSSSSISTSFATLTTNATIEWKDATVTDQVKNDIAGNRTRSQFRVHFQIETIGGDALGDFTKFESAENTGGTGNLPQLVIEYF